jgi:hypothetical protein
MNKPKEVVDEINDFLAIWDSQAMVNFLRDIIPLFELYDVEEEDDWVKNEVGEDNERNVRLIRTVYLISKISMQYSGKLSLLKMRFRDLWSRMEIESLGKVNDN